MSPWPRLTGTLPLAPPDHEEFSLLLCAFCLACLCVAGLLCASVYGRGMHGVASLLLF